MSKNFVLEGWLIKSPPSKRIWKTLCKHSILKQKWQRRWFCLRQSDELPGQYFLDYYASRTCRRLKGSINLDCCDKVQAGLHMERRGKASLNPKHCGSVFTIQTQSRTYHLEAENEFEMAKWVEAICRVCRFEVSDESPSTGVYQNHPGTVSKHERKKKKSSQRNAPTNAARAQSTGPYIPISECITGVRSRTQRAFSFDPKDILSSIRAPNRSSKRNSSIPPEIRINDIALSEYESTASEDERRPMRIRSLGPPQSSTHLRVETSLSRMSINTARDEEIIEQGPPVPPRPPKTLGRLKDLTPTGSFYVPKESSNNPSAITWIRVPLRASLSSPPPVSTATQTISTDDEDDEMKTAHSMHYYNLSPKPPVVNRALKPRLTSSGISSASSNGPSTSRSIPSSEESAKKEAVLQYLDLDLPASQPGPSGENLVTTTAIIHGRSSSKNEDYKTVDFAKTEAFNITRQDAEATRSYQQ